MYLDVFIQRYQTSQVLRQVPSTPVQQHFSSCISAPSSNSDPNSPVQLLLNSFQLGDSKAGSVFQRFHVQNG